MGRPARIGGGALGLIVTLVAEGWSLATAYQPTAENGADNQKQRNQHKGNKETTFAFKVADPQSRGQRIPYRGAEDAADDGAKQCARQ